MMIVRCPACLTIFRMRPDHLRAHGGMVRCGHCYSAFNALDHLLDEKRREPDATPSPEPEQRAAPSPEGQAAPAIPPEQPKHEAGSFFILEERDGTPDQPGTELADTPQSPLAGPDAVEGGPGSPPEFILDFDIPDSFLPSREPPERPGLEKRVRTSIPYPDLSEPETEASWINRTTAQPPPLVETPAAPDTPDRSPPAAENPAYPSTRFPDWEPDTPTVLDFEERTPDTFNARLEALEERKRSESRREPDESSPVRPLPEETPAPAPVETEITSEPPELAHEPEPAPKSETRETIQEDRAPAGPVIAHDDDDRREVVFGHDEKEAADDEPSDSDPDDAADDALVTQSIASDDRSHVRGRVLHRAAESESSPDRPWLRALGIGVLLGMLAVQGGYLFRESITRAWPELRPAYLAICEHFGCTVPLARVAGAIAIEGSDLESRGSAQGLFVLHARIGNRAHHPQAYPHVELTLTDARDRPVVRRALEPAEWLPAGKNVDAGFSAGETLDLRIPFAAPDVRNAVGYRVYAFYP